MAPALTSCCRLSSECVMFNSAPVALRWTRMSLDRARRVRGTRAPDLAILVLLSSCVARLVMQPTALHCTSTLGESICRINGSRPPRLTIRTLFSALTARLPSAADAARWTSTSRDCSRNSERQRRPDGRRTHQDRVERVPRHLAHVLLRDLRERQRRRSLQVDIVRVRQRRQRPQRIAHEEVGLAPAGAVSSVDGEGTHCSRYCSRSATASRSLSRSSGSWLARSFRAPQHALNTPPIVQPQNARPSATVESSFRRPSRA